MTANWFEVKVKYTKVDENGRQRKVSELYYWMPLVSRKRRVELSRN